MQQAICPVCHQNDRLYKVTAVISQGDYTVASSTLSDRLRMYAEPSAPSFGFTGFLLIVAAFCAFGTVVDLFYAFAPVQHGAISKSDALPGAVGFVVTGLICFLWGLGRHPKYRRQLAKYEAEHRQWVAAHTKWQTLYYCLRDDVVVSPTDNRYAPIAAWQVLLT